MSVPLELLLGVEELREVNRGFVIAEQLWHGHAQRVHRGKRRRDSISRVGADGIRERRDRARLDLKFHRRVRAPDRCHARSLEQVNYGLLGRKRARSLRSRSGRSADHASITEARVDGAMSGGAYSAMTKPRASTPTGSKASGNVLCKRRPVSSGVSPGRRSAPARLARARARLHTAITVRGRRYLEAATSSNRKMATMTPTILVSAAASSEPTLSPPPAGAPPVSVRSPRLVVGVDPAPTPAIPAMGASQPSSRRHGFWPVWPRSIGV